MSISTMTESETNGVEGADMAFALAQFDALRREIELCIAERWRIGSQMLIGGFAFYGWLFASDVRLPNDFQPYVGFLPFVFGLFQFWRWITIQSTILSIAKHIRGIEERYVRDRDLGWERVKEKERKGSRVTLGLSWDEVSTVAIWLAFLIFSFTLAVRILIEPGVLATGGPTAPATP